jgi:hypothetical protein
MNWKGVLILCALCMGWFVVARWVLPYFGAPACMSGACSTMPRPADRETSTTNAKPCPYCSGGMEKIKDEPGFSTLSGDGGVKGEK